MILAVAANAADADAMRALLFVSVAHPVLVVDSVDAARGAADRRLPALILCSAALEAAQRDAARADLEALGAPMLDAPADPDVFKAFIQEVAELLPAPADTPAEDECEEIALDLDALVGEAEASVPLSVHKAEIESVRARAEADRRDAVARARAEAEQALLERVQQVAADADARLAAQIEQVRREADEARLRQEQALAAAEQQRQEAALAARREAEESAARALEAEVARLRQEADARLTTEVERLRRESMDVRDAEVERLDAHRRREVEADAARLAEQARAREQLAEEIARVRAEAAASLADELWRAREESARARRDADAAHAVAERDREQAAQVAREAVERQAREAVAAELARVRAEAAQELAAQIAQVRRDADERLREAVQRARLEADEDRERRLAEARAEAERLREAAVDEARTTAEEAAARKMEAELERLRAAADERVREEVARVRAVAAPKESSGTIYFDAAASSSPIFHGRQDEGPTRGQTLLIGASLALVCVAVGTPFALSYLRPAATPAPVESTTIGEVSPAQAPTPRRARASTPPSSTGIPAATDPVQTSSGTGYLRIIAADGAEVWVDDERIGVTPLAEFAVPTGPRVVVIRTADGEGRYSVDVRAGRVSPVAARIASVPPPAGVEALPKSFRVAP